MNTVKRWLAGFLSFAMILTCAPFANLGTFAAVVSHKHQDAKIADSDVVATITDNEGLSAQKTYRYKELSAALTDAKSGDVIVLKKDIETTTGFAVSYTYPVTIDLNGHNITGTSNAAALIDNAGTYTVGNDTYRSLTIKGSGNIKEAEGNVAIKGVYVDGSADDVPTVDGLIGADTEIAWGIFTADPTNFVESYQGIYAKRTTSGDPIYEVGDVEPNWDWAADGSSVDFNLVIAGTGRKLLKESITLANNGTPGKAPATCTETGYEYYTAKVTMTYAGSGYTYQDAYKATTTGTLEFAPGCSIKDDNGKLKEDDNVYQTETKDERFIIKDDTEAVKNHDYDVMKTAADVGKTNKEEWTYGPKFEELNGVAIEDDDENPIYSTTLECKRNNCNLYSKNHYLVVEGAISLTKGQTVTFASENGTFQTRTTGVWMYKDTDGNGKYSSGDVQIDCLTAGDYYRLSFDILDGDNNVLIKGLYINYFTPIAKGTHSQAYVKDTAKFNAFEGSYNVKTFWVYEKNGKEIEVDATGTIDYTSTVGQQLIDYAKANDNKLVARTYQYCTANCGTKEKVDEKTISATAAAPTAVLGAKDNNVTYYVVTDGVYELNDAFEFDYKDVQANTSGHDTLKYKVEKQAVAAIDADPSMALISETYNGTSKLFAANTFDINDSNFATKEYVEKPDEFNPGVIRLQFKTGYAAFIDTNKDGKKDTSEISIDSTEVFYQVIEPTKADSQHTWTKVDKTTDNDVKATVGDGTVEKIFDNYHFEGRQASADLDGQDGFDLYYCTYKAANGQTTYQFAFVYGEDKPEGEPVSKNGTMTGGSVYIDNNTQVPVTNIAGVWVFGKNGEENNGHKASRWTYVPVQDDKVDVAGVSNGGTVGILGVAYKAQYESNGEMKDANTPQIAVFYRPEATGGGTDWRNSKGESITTPASGRTSVPATYAVVKDNPEDVDCDDFVKYTGLNEGLPAEYRFASDTYVFTSSTPGTKHSSVTGTVNWKTEGSATVKLVCDKCKLEQKEEIENLKIKKTNVVEPTCTEDGYTEYKATYKGLLENVTLVNDTFKGSPVAAPGHEVSATSKLFVTKDGETYKGQVYCDRCEEYHDDVKSIEGPRVEDDKSRTIKVNYTNGLAEFDSKKVKNENYKDERDGLTQTLTLIDGVDPDLGFTQIAGEYTAIYGQLSDWAITQEAFEDLELENGDILTPTSIYDKSTKKIYQSEDSSLATYNTKAVPLSVVVTDADGNVIKAPRRINDAKDLPVGEYTLTITGLQTSIVADDNSMYNYTGTITKKITVVEAAGQDYVLNDFVDDDNKGEVSNERVPYDGVAHTYKVKAFISQAGAAYNNIDKDVTISYKLEGKDASEADLSFIEAGTYNIEITATKANHQTQTKKVKFTINKAEIEAAIDNATMVEGAVPNIRYTLKRKDDSKAPIDEKDMGFKIVSSGGDDLTKLKPGKYAMKGIATNENYEVTTVGYGSTSTAAPQIEVFAKDDSSAQEQALADAVTKQINELGDNPSEADVTAARKAYDALSAKAKARVSADTLKKLTSAEDKVAADKVIAAFAGNDKTAAYEAYSKLTDAQKKLVEAKVPADQIAAGKTGYDKKAADGVVSMLSKVNDNMSESEAKKIVNAYNALTADQKALVNANATASANLTKAKQIANRKNATYKLKKKTYSIKKPKKGKKSKKVKIKVEGKGGKKTFKKTKGKKFIKVSKKGKITVTSGAKKGTYKIKVKITAPQTANYKKFNKTYQIKVKVK